MKRLTLNQVHRLLVGAILLGEIELVGSEIGNIAIALDGYVSEREAALLLMARVVLERRARIAMGADYRIHEDDFTDALTIVRLVHEDDE